MVLGELWTSAASAAPADNLYQYVFGNSSYTVACDGTVDVSVYLQETVGPQGTPVLSSSGVGLSTAGVKVLFSDPPQPIQPTRVLKLTDIWENMAFDFPTPSLTDTDADLALATLLNPSVTGEEISPGVYRLLLGTFHFTAGTVAGESTPIRATDYDPRFDDVVTGGDMRVLDNLIQDGSATITTVPEPAAVEMLAAAILAGGLLWKFRRNLGRNARQRHYK